MSIKQYFDSKRALSSSSDTEQPSSIKMCTPDENMALILQQLSTKLDTLVEKQEEMTGIKQSLDYISNHYIMGWIKVRLDGWMEGLRLHHHHHQISHMYYDQYNQQ